MIIALMETCQVSGVSYPLKPNDSMPWRDANGMTLQLPDEVEATTLALLMKDVTGHGRLTWDIVGQTWDILGLMDMMYLNVSKCI